MDTDLLTDELAWTEREIAEGDRRLAVIDRQIAAADARGDVAEYDRLNAEYDRLDRWLAWLREEQYECERALGDAETRGRPLFAGSL